MVHSSLLELLLLLLSNFGEITYSTPKCIDAKLLFFFSKKKHFHSDKIFPHLNSKSPTRRIMSSERERKYDLSGFPAKGPILLMSFAWVDFEKSISYFLPSLHFRIHKRTSIPIISSCRVGILLSSSPERCMEGNQLA